MTDLQKISAAAEAAEVAHRIAAAAFSERKNKYTRRAMQDARSASQAACNAYMAACLAAGRNFMAVA